jgi:hypothetical protein
MKRGMGNRRKSEQPKAKQESAKSKLITDDKLCRNAGK